MVPPSVTSDPDFKVTTVFEVECRKTAQLKYKDCTIEKYT